MKLLVLATVTVAALGSGTTHALADTKAEQRRDCIGKGTPGGASPSHIVAQCTALIDAGTLKKAELARAFRERGGAHHFAGELDQAIADYDRALEIDPNYAEVLALRGDVERSKGNMTGAISYYDRAIAIDPRASYFKARGQTYSEIESPGHFEKAIADYSRALQLKPDMFAALTDRGVAYGWLGRYAEAFADFDKSLKIKPHFNDAAYLNRAFAYYETKQYRKSLDDLDQIKPNSGKTNNPRAYALRGFNYEDLNKYRWALRSYDEALRNNPQFVPVLTARGKLYAWVGEHDLALRDFDAAIAIEPGNFDVINRRADAIRAKQNAKPETQESAVVTADPAELLRLCAGTSEHDIFRKSAIAACTAWIDGKKLVGDELTDVLDLRGLALLRGRQWNAAIADFDAALKLKPDDATKLNHRGMVFAGAGNPKQALADFNRAIALDPNNAEALSLRGGLLLERSNYMWGDDRRLGARDINNALKIAPTLAVALHYQGFADFYDGDYGSALEHFQEANKRDPDDDHALLGQCVYYLGPNVNYERATQYCDAALSIAPNDPEILFNRARVHLGLKQTEQALADIDHALASQPNYAVALFLRGFIYWQDGKIDRAATEYAAALQANPNVVNDYMAYVKPAANSDPEQYTKILDSLDQIIVAQPDSYWAYRARGDFHLFHSRYLDGDHQKGRTRAGSDYRDAIKHNSADALSFEKLGWSYATEARQDPTASAIVERAMDAFAQALNIKADYQQVFAQRGQLYATLEEYPKAINDLDQAIRLDPDDAASLEARGNIYFKLGQFDRAIADLSAYLKLFDLSGEAFFRRGSFYSQSGQYEAAIDDFARAIELEGHGHGVDSNLALNGRAWARAKWGRELDKALADCNKALTYENNWEPGVETTAAQYLNIHDTRAAVYYLLRRYAKAIADANIVLKVQPKRASSLLVRGLARKRLGQEAQGAADIAAAIAINKKLVETYAGYGIGDTPANGRVK